MDLGISGLASGFDWRTFVDKMIAVERQPEQTLATQQNKIEQKQVAYGSIKTQLLVVQNRADALKDPALFDSRTSQSSDTTVASATASAGAPLGTFTFAVTQLAKAAQLNGSSNIASPLSSTNDVSGVMLSSGAFPKAVTAGTFTINGAQVTINATDSLQDVFNSIQTATGGDVTASYDTTTDEITLTSAGPEIVLGSATDTSNFLQAAKLYNNGGTSVSSSASLGSIQPASTLINGNFATAISDGGAGQGAFTINGVTISYSATGDSLNNVIDRINNSNAGVIATYDQLNDRVVLTNKSTGDTGITIQDVTGNFAAATGLASATLQHGSNLLYSVNGGGTLVSATNTITSESSGLSGLTVTASQLGTTSITVGSDTDGIKTAINDFITEYNNAQSLIDTNTASSTDSKGKVTAGTLSDESDADEIASKLRSLAYDVVSGLSSDMNQLSDLGITTNGYDNKLALTDETALDSALANNLSGVKKLFSDPDNGLAVKLDKYLENTAGDSGSLDAKNTKLSKQSAAIDTQIADMERLITADQTRLINSFVSMETAQAQINQQLQFLAQRFGTSGPTSTPASSSSSS
jgi:flagellar hook-associated protein 2